MTKKRKFPFGARKKVLKIDDFVIEKKDSLLDKQVFNEEDILKKKKSSTKKVRNNQVDIHSSLEDKNKLSKLQNGLVSTLSDFNKNIDFSDEINIIDKESPSQTEFILEKKGNTKDNFNKDSKKFLLKNKVAGINKKLEENTSFEVDNNRLENSLNKENSALLYDDNQKKDNDQIELEKKVTKPISYTKRAFVFAIILIFIGAGIYTFYNYRQNKLIEEKRQRDEQIVSTIKEHFNNNVKVIEDAIIYSYNETDDDYQKAGVVYRDIELTLENIEITPDTKYFYIKELDSYIEYQNVSPIDELTEVDNRYKKYIPFNKNVVTKDNFTLYEEDAKIYTFNKSMSFPIIINDYNGKYYVEFNNRLLYVLEDEIEEMVDNNNTSLTNVKNVAVLNYHFIYDSSTKCNQSICLSDKNFEKHLEYIKEENIFTLTMHEFELYLDKKIQIPKSVLLTFDDGWLRQTAIPILDKYEVNATFFLVTSWYLPIESKYVEFHSHTHNMHNQGDCPTGQGGGIKCLDESFIQEDLKKSRSILNNTTAFCYPFYEYNNYAISQLKKAGFSMAFIGGGSKAYPGVNKYKIPRYIIYKTTSVYDLKKII